MTQAFQQAPFSDRFNFPWYLNSKELLGDAVEVGTHRGGFAHRFLHYWIGRRLWCVDPYLGGYDDRDPASRGDREADYGVAVELLKGYGDRVRFIKEPSIQAVARFDKDSLCFVYIDGCHKTAEILRDLRVWWPKVGPGGLLAGHDFLEIGSPWGEEVQPAVAAFARENGLTVYLVTEPSLAPWSYYFVKSFPLSPVK